MKKYFLAAVLCISLSGCVTATGTSSLAYNAPTVVMQAEKALTVAHLAYQGLSVVLLNSANNGLIKGEDARRAKFVYDQAGDALKVADKADAAANENDLVAAVRTATDAIVQAQNILKGK